MEPKVTRKNIFSGLVWKFAERIIAQGIQFIISIVLARILLPDEYGTIAIVLIFITLANVFISSGFSAALIQKKDATTLDFSTMFICSLICSVLIYVLLFFSAPGIALFYQDPILEKLIRVFALVIPLSVYNTIQHAYVSRNMLFKKFFWSTLFGTVISGVLGIIFALQGFGVWALVIQYSVNVVIDTLVLSFTIPWHPNFTFSRTAAKPLMKYGWKVLAADFSGTFFDQLRSILIGRFYLLSELAFYNKGKQFPDLLTNNLVVSVMSVLFPALSNINDDKARVKEMIRKALQLLSFVMIPMLAGLCAVARPLIITLLTEKWEGSIIFLRLLCVSSVFSLIGSISIQAIKAIGRSDVLLKLEFIKKPVYLILLLWGLKEGVVAIAVTMVLYSLYGTLVNAHQLKKYLQYGYREQLLDVGMPICISAIMSILVWLVEWIGLGYLVTLVLQVIIGITFYLLVAEVTGNKSWLYISGMVKTAFRNRKNQHKKGGLRRWG